MAGSPKFRTPKVSSILLILIAISGGIMGSGSELSSSPSTFTAHLVDKYKCDMEHLSSVLGRSSSESRTQKSVKIICTKRHLMFVNISYEEFMEHEYNGVLEVVSLRRKFERDKFCVMRNTSNTSHGHSSHRGSKLELALCDEESELTKSAGQKPNSPIEIRKCCLPNQRLDLVSLADDVIDRTTHNYKCVDIPPDAKQKEWNPAVFQSTSDDYKEHTDLQTLSNAVYSFGFQNCSMMQALNNSKDIWFMLLATGSVEIGLKFWFKPVWLPVKDNAFCLDEFVDHDPSSLADSSANYSHRIYHKNQILLYCQIQDFDEYLFHRRLFGGMCVTAAVIVFVLLLIYVSIWDKQNLAGWTQFNIFVALFFVVLMEGVRTLVDVNALQINTSSGCVVIAAIAQYFFFALNTTWFIMCFDLFYMFWKLETTTKTVARYKGRLICYLIFSWGLPFVVVLTAFYLSHSTAAKEMNKMEGVYAFAHRRCSSPIRTLGFLTQGIMFLFNLLFFLLTTSLLWKHRRGLNAVKKKSRSERHTWRSVILFTKLVIVMGVTSLSIPMDFLFGSSNPLSVSAVCFRLVHFIPFFAILFIFGFNDKNILLIKQKYPQVGRHMEFLLCNPGAVVSETGNHSRSGNGTRSDREHPSLSAS